jgi:hypothetical protein
MHKLARRVVSDSGGTRLRALADIRAAAELAIAQQVAGPVDAEQLLDEVLIGPERRTWVQIGEELGVSAQAAQRKYVNKSPRRTS